MTKKIISGALIAAALATGTCIADQPIQTTYSHLYGRTTIVTQIDHDIVYCDDYAGLTWSFVGAEDWCIDDVATFVMYDNCTEDITDDVIINVSYGGNIGG